MVYTQPDMRNRRQPLVFDRLTLLFQDARVYMLAPLLVLWCGISLNAVAGRGLTQHQNLERVPTEIVAHISGRIESRMANYMN